MGSLFIVVSLVVVIVTFTYGVARSLLHVWLEHRVKLALLEKYERHPELFDSSQEVLDLLATQERAAKKTGRQDYAVTGVLLSLIGIGCVIAGRIIGLGKLAVGIYLGGITCIILGVLIALLGLLIRALGKNTLTQPQQT